MRQVYAVRTVMDVEDVENSDYRDFYTDMAIDVYPTAEAAIAAVAKEAKVEHKELTEAMDDEETGEKLDEESEILEQATEFWTKNPGETFTYTAFGLSWLVRQVLLHD